MNSDPHEARRLLPPASLGSQAVLFFSVETNIISCISSSIRLPYKAFRIVSYLYIFFLVQGEK